MKDEIDFNKLLDGFNHGFIIKNYRPQLFLQIAKIKPKSNYLQGFEKGGERFEMEKRLGKLKSNRDLSEERKNDREK